MTARKKLRGATARQYIVDDCCAYPAEKKRPAKSRANVMHLSPVRVEWHKRTPFLVTEVGTIHEYRSPMYNGAIAQEIADRVNHGGPRAALERLLTIPPDETLCQAEQDFVAHIKDDKGFDAATREMIAEAFDNQARYRGEGWRR